MLLFILFGQGLWIFNMYQAYRDQWASSVNKSIEKAILREGSNRNEQSGGWVSFTPLTAGTDTARYIKKMISTVDTSFQVTLDRYDPHSLAKLNQFLMKDNLPVNTQQLDSLFRQELRGYLFPLSGTRVEYMDLKSKKILASFGQPSRLSSAWISTDLIPIDIFSTLGIQAYAKINSIPILRRMAFQLFLSFMLTSFCIFLLFKIVNTFFWNEKVELMRQQSISTMTHEFKRPISSAVALVALIPYYVKKEDAGRVVKYAENTLLELNKLTLYTERIQRISSGVNVKLSLNKERVYLPDFFNRVLEKYAVITEKNMTLNVELKSMLSYLNMDLLHMSNVIDNLIENAIKYSGDELIVTISVEDVKGYLLVQVKDNGLGISKTELPLVFDKYFRSSTVDNHSAKGFGLGLTYCKLVVKEHGGTIQLQSELGLGSTFSVLLPNGQEV